VPFFLQNIIHMALSPTRNPQSAIRRSEQSMIDSPPYASTGSAPLTLGKAFILTLSASLCASAQASPDPAQGFAPSAVQRVEKALARIDSLDGDYGAVIALNREAALAQARAIDEDGPVNPPVAAELIGEPILLKDNIESLELATTAGSLALADNATGRDADLVRQLRDAGAVILGKTNLSEWANFRSEHSISGWSAVGGQTRNAVDRARSPCGSSAGSAVAVALGYVRVAIGTETSGSIVCPASVNGVVGFKPTHGLVSGAGIVPLALSQDTAGPIAQNVSLAALTLAAIANPDVGPAAPIVDGLLGVASLASLKGMRVGVFANTQGYDPRRDRELQKTLTAFEKEGAILVQGLRITPYEGFSAHSYDVLLYEFRRDLNHYLASRPNAHTQLQLDSLIAFNEAHALEELRYFDQSIFIKSRDIADSEAEYLEKREAIRRAMREDGLDQLFAEHDLDLLVGITESPAWMIDTVNGDALFGPGMAAQAAIAGNPHITLPLGAVAGLPLGISLVGERWLDHKLAQTAYRLEQLLPAPSYAESRQAGYAERKLQPELQE
jgi:amidase